MNLLAGAAVAIALAFAGAAGVFLVRRRSAEAALLYARGEHVAAFACPNRHRAAPARRGRRRLRVRRCARPHRRARRVGLGRRARRWTLRSGTRRSPALAALLLAAGAAAVVFARQFDSGVRAHRWLRRIPWELPLLAIAGWLLYDVLSGGGLSKNTTHRDGSSDARGLRLPAPARGGGRRARDAGPAGRPCGRGPDAAGTCRRRRSSRSVGSPPRGACSRPCSSSPPWRSAPTSTPRRSPRRSTRV